MTTYYYVADWKDRLIDSSLFHNRYGHENPTIFPIKNRVQIAAHVNIGNFELGMAAKSEITNFIDITSDTRPDDPSIKLHSGLYYHCNDVFNPEIGDIRLQFTTAGIEGNYVRDLVSQVIHIPNFNWIVVSFSSTPSSDNMRTDLLCRTKPASRRMCSSFYRVGIPPKTPSMQHTTNANCNRGDFDSLAGFCCSLPSPARQNWYPSLWSICHLHRPCCRIRSNHSTEISYCRCRWHSSSVHCAGSCCDLGSALACYAQLFLRFYSAHGALCTTINGWAHEPVNFDAKCSNKSSLRIILKNKWGILPCTHAWKIGFDNN